MLKLMYHLAKRSCKIAMAYYGSPKHQFSGGVIFFVDMFPVVDMKGALLFCRSTVIHKGHHFVRVDGFCMVLCQLFPVFNSCSHPPF